MLTHSGVSPNGCFDVLQQQINQIRRFFSTHPNTTFNHNSRNRDLSGASLLRFFVPVTRPGKGMVRVALVTPPESRVFTGSFFSVTPILGPLLCNFGVPSFGFDQLGEASADTVLLRDFLVRHTGGLIDPNFEDVCFC